MLSQRERDLHRERQRRYVHRQRADGDYTTDQWKRLCERYGNRCLKCGKPGDYRTLTVDHIVSVNHGGTNYIWNLQPLCNKCNREKGDQDIDYRPSYLQGALFPAIMRPENNYDR